MNAAPTRHSPVDATVLKSANPKTATGHVRKIITELTRALAKPSKAARRKHGMSDVELLAMIATITDARDALEVQAKRLAVTAGERGITDASVRAALNVSNDLHPRWTTPHPTLLARGHRR